MKSVVFVLGYLILAPFVGALLDGADRVITARMQGRKGPSILQPFYDLSKLFSKQMIAVNNVQLLLNLSYLGFIVISGGMLFGGTDILMCLFILSTADMFLVMAASSDSSPFANMGAAREMVQMMAYEPLTLLVAVGFYLASGTFHVGDILMCLFILSTADMFLVMAASSDSSPFANMGAAREMVQMMAYEPLTLLVAVGFYLASGTFHVGDIIQSDLSPVLYMPGMLLGFMFTAAIKFRKSPFDLSTSHHAHQEMVKGITTEMSGTTLGIMNVAEYYEKVLILGIFALFFINSSWWSWPVAIVLCLGIYFLEILWDNVSARLRWKTLLFSCWLVTLLTAGVNLLILILMK